MYDFGIRATFGQLPGKGSEGKDETYSQAYSEAEHSALVG